MIYSNNIAPLMTANTCVFEGQTFIAQSNYTYGGSSYDYYQPYNVFNRQFAQSNRGWVSTDNAPSGTYLRINLNYNISKAVTKYAIACWNATANAPRSWTFEGSNNGTNWTVLDTQTNVSTGWVLNTLRSFEFENTNTYTWYQLKFSAINGGTNYYIDEVELYENGSFKKILLSDGTDLYKIVSNELVSVGSVVSKSIFDTHGMDSISILPHHVSELSSLRIMSYSSEEITEVSTTAIPVNTIITPTGDIDLTGTTFNDIVLSANNIKMLVSFDSGVTWNGWNGDWVETTLSENNFSLGLNHAYTEVNADAIPTLSQSPQIVQGITYTISASNGATPYKVFNNSNLTADKWITGTNKINGEWIKIQLSDDIIPYKYSIQIPPDTGDNSKAPKKWYLQGSNDDSTWYNLDFQEDITWNVGEKKEFSFDNVSPFEYLRLFLIENNGSDCINIGEWELFSKVSTGFTSISEEKWQEKVTDTIRFAYLLEQNNSAELVYTNELSLDVTLLGRFVITPCVIQFLSNTALKVKLTANGTYKVNYQ